MSSQTEQAKFISRMSKGELHAHFNGVISGSLVQEILIEEGAIIPDGFDLQHDLVIRTPCASLGKYLKPWQVLRRIPSNPSNLKRLANNAFESLKANNVKFVELRSSVTYLAMLQKCAIAVALARLIEAIGESAIKYGVQSGIVLTVPRSDSSAVNLQALLHAYHDLGQPTDVVGLDLAGDEETLIPKELPSCFRAAKDKFGFGITIHAGETGRLENIVSAVCDFGADRIGHGTAAGTSPYVMDMLCKRNVCVEVCPISNRLTNAVKQSEMHPLCEFLRKGVPFVICSDNPGLHERGLNDDYAAAISEGVDLTCLQSQLSTATAHSFLKLKPYD